MGNVALGFLLAQRHICLFSIRERSGDARKPGTISFIVSWCYLARDVLVLTPVNPVAHMEEAFQCSTTPLINLAVYENVALIYFSICKFWFSFMCL